MTVTVVIVTGSCDCDCCIICCGGICKIITCNGCRCDCFGFDCCDDVCKILTCNGCNCDCCGSDCCCRNGGGSDGRCHLAYMCCITSDLDSCENNHRGKATRDTGTKGTYAVSNQPVKAIQLTNVNIQEKQKHNRKNQNMKTPNIEVQNSEPENYEVIKVQHPTYEETVPVELDLDQPVTTQPQSSVSTS